MKNLKVGKSTANHFRKYCEGFFDVDLLSRGSRPKIINPATLKGQIDDIRKNGTTSEIDRRLEKVQLWMDDCLANLTVNQQGCFAHGLTAGIAFSMAIMELARVRGGKREHPVNDFIRQVYTEQPGEQKKYIVLTGIDRFKKANPRKKCPSPGSRIAHFAEIIKKTHDNG